MAERTTWRRTGWAALLSGAVGVAAWRRGALSPSGAAGALLTGTCVTGAGGWDWGAALVYFFVSSSALSRVASTRKRAVAADKFAKGGRRDLWQALANAGVASALALARAAPWGARLPWAHRLRAAFAGALATANADTWATEIGTLSARAPHLITTGRRVAPGTSGGVTPLGLAATIAGAGTLGLAFALAGRRLPDPACERPRHTRDSGLLARVGVALAGGVVGALADSVLGATAQAMYWCPRCRTETERRQHRCGTHTIHQRGWQWVDNDAVNAASTLIGAVVSGALTRSVR